ncbi:MAG: DUF2249 domain-containing protein [Silvibacterium sp.]
MHKLNLRELTEFDDAKFFPKVLMNRPGYRLVLLNMRSGQGIPEHATKEMVTVYAISGHITFYEDQVPFDLQADEVLCIDGGVPHKLEAHEDSSLLVLAAGNSSPSINEELDLREVPRPQRHPLVFAKFDGLAVGESFVVINDHDPVPLNRQMDAMRPGQVAWEYIKRGPDIFRIRILRIALASSEDVGVSIGTQPEGLLREIQRV